nr:MAG TPA: hypothetical protein [Caudoviricetes sp.]
MKPHILMEMYVYVNRLLKSMVINIGFILEDQ